MTTTDTNSGKLTFTVMETAEALSIGRSTVYELINTGDLPSFTIGSRRLIARADVHRYISQRLDGGASPR